MCGLRSDWLGDGQFVRRITFLIAAESFRSHETAAAAAAAARVNSGGGEIVATASRYGARQTRVATIDRAMHSRHGHHPQSVCLDRRCRDYLVQRGSIHKSIYVATKNVGMENVAP